MKLSLIAIAVLAAASLAVSTFGQQTPTSPAAGGKMVNTGQVPVPANPAGGAGATAPSAQPSAADMQKMMQQMMELGKPGENHKMLADTAGTWNYTVKMWMDGDTSAKPQESKGTATRKMIMNGRFLVGDYTGMMKMPGSDGKMKDVTFKGMGLEAYDNVKKKFVATWMDNMGTGIMTMEGDYDPATKSLTSTGEEEMMPGMKTQIRSVTKFPDKNHMTLEWYENHGGGEKKTMEINYTKAK
jgi:hypothetical protein